MKVKMITEHDGWGYDSLEIEVDGNSKFSVSSSDDSPEDNNLLRNFSDCYGIGELMELAYNAGKNGEEFELEYEDVEIE